MTKNKLCIKDNMFCKRRTKIKLKQAYKRNDKDKNKNLKMEKLKASKLITKINCIASKSLVKQT